MNENLHSTTDAAVWAKAFIEQHLEEAGAAAEAVLDEGTMLTWFANAIETGRTAGQGPLTRLLVSDEAVEEACAFYHAGHGQHPDDWASLPEREKAWYRAAMKNLAQHLLDGGR